MPRSLTRILALLFAVLAALGTIELIDDDGDGRPDRVVVPLPHVTSVDGADQDTARDEQLPLDRSARAGLDRALNGETAHELTDALREPADPSRTPPGHLEGPLAAQEFPGCRTAFVRNYSSRNGVAPREIVWHQTVSRENGTSSQNALTAMANRPSSGVSWHFLIGRSRGLCTLTVPLNMKAWTQANANPFSIGIEVEAYGDEGAYVTGAGKRKLLAVTRELGRRFNIPMQHGRVSNCSVVRPGIVEHSELGACGGGHVDVTLTTPVQTLALIHEAAAGQFAPPDTDAERQACASLRYQRRHVAAGASWQDIVTNRHGQRVRRQDHAQAKKRLLRRGRADDRTCR